MKKIIFILIATVIFACNKSDDVNKNGSTFDCGMSFSVFNANNEDLLDPATPNHLDQSQIKLFYLINGKIVEIFDAKLDNPRNYMIFKHENEYRIGLTLNYSADTCITYLQWNLNDMDTLKAAYRTRTSSAVIRGKVWLNGEPVWDWTKDNDDAYYKIIK